MGLFGVGRNEERTERRVSPLEKARDAYQQRRKAFEKRDALRLSADTGEEWLLDCEDTALSLFPLIDAYRTEDTEAIRRADAFRLPRPESKVEKCAPLPEQLGEEGMFRFYRKPETRLSIESARFSRRGLRVRGGDRAQQWLTEKGLAAFLPVFDLFDCTPPVLAVCCEEECALFPKRALGGLQVFRTAEELVFVTEPRGQGGTFGVGRLPVSAVRFYRLRGGVRTETKVSGGEVTIDREGALWGGVFSMNTNADMLENAIRSTPIRTEQIEHDERCVELRVRWNGTVHKPAFTPDSLAAFDALLPEKEFDEVALSGHQPTAAEQLCLLADLCERGYLTRAEFDAAKRKLLGEAGL